MTFQHGHVTLKRNGLVLALVTTKKNLHLYMRRAVHWAVDILRTVRPRGGDGGLGVREDVGGRGGGVMEGFLVHQQTGGARKPEKLRSLNPRPIIRRNVGALRWNLHRDRNTRRDYP